MPNNLVEHPRVAMVPVARPDTAKQMLELAVEMVHPEEGKVIALVVVLENTEKASQLTESLQPAIKKYVEDGHDVEIETIMATSVSRGILDAARERGADVLLLGVQKPDRRQVQLGSIVENVMQASPCNVLVYRLSESPSYRRIAVPLDGTRYSNIALRMGVLLAKSHHVPLHLYYVQRDYVFAPDNEIQMRDMLALLPDDAEVDKIIIAGDDPATRILGELDEHDLVIMGFSQRADFDHEMSNRLAERLLNRAPGPMMLTSQLQYQPSLQGLIMQRIRRMNPRLTIAEQNEMVWHGRRLAEPNMDYIMLIVLSAGIAALGLMLNSVAVIIGAMLVAPLMQPLTAFATGLVSAQLRLIRRAGFSLILGVILALLFSMLLGIVLPLDSATPEMLARGNPSLIDAAVALVSGLVGAYAAARKGISSALAGVAIAAALMPPLCTVGLGFALQNTSLAFGSGLLFLTNIVFIIAAQAGIFLWLGLRPRERVGSVSKNWTRIGWIGITTMMAVVVFVIIGLRQQALDEQAIADELIDIFEPAEFVEFELERGNPPTALMTLRSVSPITPRQVGDAQARLRDILERDIQLEVVYMQVIRTENVSVVVTNFLEEAFSSAEIVTLLVEGADPVVVTATLRAETPIDEDMVIAAQESLTEELGTAVSLQLTVEQITTIEVTEEP